MYVTRKVNMYVMSTPELKRKRSQRKKNPIIEMEASYHFLFMLKTKVVHILMRYKYKRPKLNGN